MFIIFNTDSILLCSGHFSPSETRPALTLPKTERIAHSCAKSDPAATLLGVYTVTTVIFRLKSEIPKADLKIVNEVYGPSRSWMNANDRKHANVQPTIIRETMWAEYSIHTSCRILTVNWYMIELKEQDCTSHEHDEAVEGYPITAARRKMRKEIFWICFCGQER